MADRVMRALALIEAQDKTGKAFATAAAKVGQMSKAMKAMEKAGAGASAEMERLARVDAFDKARRQWASARTAFREAERDVQRLGREMRQAANPSRQLANAYDLAQQKVSALARAYRETGEAAKRANREMKATQATARRPLLNDQQRGAIRDAFGNVVAPAAAYAAVKTGQKFTHYAADVLHERALAKVAGMKPEEVKKAEAEAAHTSEQVRGISKAEGLGLIREMRVVTGSLDEAMHVLPEVAKLKVISDSHRGEGPTDPKEFVQLIKGLEILGKTQDPKEFREYLDFAAKGMNTFGSLFRPSDFFQLAKYSRQAGLGFSKKFLTTLAPSLGQELSASSAGNALSTFHGTVVGGKMKNVAADEFDRLGLVAPGKITRTKTGSVKGIKMGGIKNWQIAASDPDVWVNETLLPALEKAGITKEEDQLATVSTLFRDRTAAQLVGILLRQHQRLQKDRGMINSAQGLESASVLTAEDPFANLRALQDQVKNFGAALAEPAVLAAGPLLTNLSSGISSLTHALEDSGPATRNIVALTGGLVGLYAVMKGSSWVSDLVGGLKGGGAAAALTGSATALDGSAAALTRAAVALGAKGLDVPGAPEKKPGGKPSLSSRLLNVAHDVAVIGTAVELFRIAYDYAKEADKNRYVGPSADVSWDKDKDWLLERSRRAQQERNRDPEAARGRAFSRIGDSQLEAVVKPDQIKAEITGSAAVTFGTIKVEPSSAMLEIINKAQAIVKSDIRGLRFTANGPGSNGTSSPDAE
ncbi:MAG: hypothetical protein LCH93_24240 [Proteobacteria bacterium]|nr:hypothetical protein [Pseudomonadota bacterium]